MPEIQILLRNTIDGQQMFLDYKRREGRRGEIPVQWESSGWRQVGVRPGQQSAEVRTALQCRGCWFSLQSQEHAGCCPVVFPTAAPSVAASAVSFQPAPARVWHGSWHMGGALKMLTEWNILVALTVPQWTYGSNSWKTKELSVYFGSQGSGNSSIAFS